MKMSRLLRRRNVRLKMMTMNKKEDAVKLFQRTRMEEFKLFLTGLILFTVTLLPGILKERYPSQPKVKVKAVIVKPVIKAECTAIIIPFIWSIHYGGSGCGAGGGGGWAF